MHTVTRADIGKEKIECSRPRQRERETERDREWLRGGGRERESARENSHVQQRGI
jgi:hypothetical protein